MIMDTTLFDAMLFCVARRFGRHVSTAMYSKCCTHQSRKLLIAVSCMCCDYLPLTSPTDHNWKSSINRNIELAFQSLFPNTALIKSNITKNLETSTKVWVGTKYD